MTSRFLSEEDTIARHCVKSGHCMQMCIHLFHIFRWSYCCFERWSEGLASLPFTSTTYRIVFAYGRFSVIVHRWERSPNWRSSPDTSLMTYLIHCWKQWMTSQRREALSSLRNRWLSGCYDQMKYVVNTENFHLIGERNKRRNSRMSVCCIQSIGCIARGHRQSNNHGVRHMFVSRDVDL